MSHVTHERVTSHLSLFLVFVDSLQQQITLWIPQVLAGTIRLPAATPGIPSPPLTVTVGGG